MFKPIRKLTGLGQTWTFIKQDTGMYKDLSQLNILVAVTRMIYKYKQ